MISYDRPLITGVVVSHITCLQALGEGSGAEGRGGEKKAPPPRPSKTPYKVEKAQGPVVQSPIKLIVG